jgi:hypothetical protein
MICLHSPSINYGLSDDESKEPCTGKIVIFLLGGSGTWCHRDPMSDQKLLKIKGSYVFKYGLYR